ncbi:MAG: hypothetical protein KDD69_18425, partial [Bdellovibrionales bacterium]|nr:hypothetical protein [Bdellovibrionales bacterium]
GGDGRCPYPVVLHDIRRLVRELPEPPEAIAGSTFLDELEVLLSSLGSAIDALSAPTANFVEIRQLLASFGPLLELAHNSQSDDLPFAGYVRFVVCGVTSDVEDFLTSCAEGVRTFGEGLASEEFPQSLLTTALHALEGPPQVLRLCTQVLPNQPSWTFIRSELALMVSRLQCWVDDSFASALASIEDARETLSESPAEFVDGSHAGLLIRVLEALGRDMHAAGNDPNTVGLKRSIPPLVRELRKAEAYEAPAETVSVTCVVPYRGKKADIQPRLDGLLKLVEARYDSALAASAERWHWTAIEGPEGDSYEWREPNEQQLALNPRQRVESTSAEQPIGTAH